MGIIEDRRTEIQEQFIHVEVAMSLIAQIENCSESTVAEWLIPTGILKSQKILEYRGEFEVFDYCPLCEVTGEYLNPNQAVEELIYNGYFFGDYGCLNAINLIGFAKKRFLYSLVDAGIAIPKDYLLAAKSYIPSGYDSDEMSDDYSHLITQLQITESQNKELLEKIISLENLLDKYRNDNNDFKSVTYEREEEFLKTIDEQAQRIAELEAKQQATTQPQQAGIFELITDETHKHYAPDLAHAANLWHSVYIQNPKNDSHNNKANTWIKNNTPYSGGQEDTATRRIREITTPYSDWHPSRKN